MRALPVTSNFCVGVVVPIPTFPLTSTIKLSDVKIPLMVVISLVAYKSI